jgi:hypothetical protein
MKRLFYLSLLILFVIEQKSYACSCGLSHPSPGDAFASADVVIVGAVMKIDPEISKGFAPQVAYVQVEKSYKGYEEAEIVFHQPGHSCSPTYNAGERHLFYVNRTKENRWEVYGCGRSRSFDDAGDDLMYLDALPESAQRTRLSGTISHYENLPQKGFSRIGNLGGIKVRIIGDKKTWELYTDGNGVYEKYDLPPGKYAIEPEIPAGMKILFPHFFGLLDYSDRKRLRLDLRANACAGSDFVLSADNVIRGKVFGDEGQALVGVCLDLVPADVPAEKTASHFRIFDCTKKEGKFELEEAPPGKYMLVVNKDGKLSGSEPFPPTYYPGVFEKKNAAVITIGFGESLENVDIHIPTQAETIMIQGVLTYADGRPAAREKVKFKASEEIDNRDLKASNLSDEQGRFSLTILKGTKGRLYGSISLYEGRFLNCPAVEKLIDQRARSDKTRNWADFETAPIEIDGENSRTKIQLTFPFPMCEKRKD